MATKTLSELDAFLNAHEFAARNGTLEPRPYNVKPIPAAELRRPAHEAAALANASAADVAALEQAEVDYACAERINNTQDRREAMAATRARLDAIRARLFPSLLAEVRAAARQRVLETVN